MSVTSDALDRYLEHCGQLCAEQMSSLYSPEALSNEGQLYDLILDYPSRGGKAIRPALAIATCLGLGGRLPDVLPTAATLELYHNAFLIHDDIEDGSLYRRNKPTMHTEHGIPMAINVGDAMLSLSLQPLLDNVAVVGLGRALRILQAVASMTRITVEGQAMELEWIRDNEWNLDDGDYLEMVERKTSWYSFIVPMQVGAIAAGADDQTIRGLESLGRHLGAAFQITDDLLNLRADPDDYGKEIGGDLWEGKRTLILLHTLRTCDAADRSKAVEILGGQRPDLASDSDLQGLLEQLMMTGDLTAAGFARIRSLGGSSDVKSWGDVQWLHDLVRRSGSLDHGRRVAAGLAEAAGDDLAALSALGGSTHRTMIEDLVDFVHERAR